MGGIRREGGGEEREGGEWGREEKERGGMRDDFFVRFLYFIIERPVICRSIFTQSNKIIHHSNHPSISPTTQNNPPYPLPISPHLTLPKKQSSHLQRLSLPRWRVGFSCIVSYRMISSSVLYLPTYILLGEKKKKKRRERGGKEGGKEEGREGIFELSR